MGRLSEPCIQRVPFLYMMFDHSQIIPYYSKSNGECKRFLKNIGKTMRIAHSMGTDWRSEQAKFVINYRATSHSTLLRISSNLLFSEPFPTTLPENDHAITKDRFGFNERDQRSKDLMMRYADHRRKARTKKTCRQGTTSSSVNMRKTSPCHHSILTCLL